LKPRGKKAAFAAKMNVNPSQVSRWIRGATPDEELWPQIEEAAGMPSGTLMRTNWRDEASRLQAQIDALDTRVLKQGQQLARLAASRRREPPPSPQLVDQSP
jgi:transposase-like protein